MRRKLTVGLAMLVFLAFIMNPASAVASDEVAFHLKATEEDGTKIRIAVQAHNLADAYAYELNVSYDSLRLRFVEAKSATPGFAVPPIAEGKQVRIAHTKVGHVPGIDGNAELAVLTFERIRGGDAAVELREARLVDSQLEMKVFKGNSQVTIEALSDPMSLSDIAGHWAEATIMEAVELGFVIGFEDGTFRPQHEVTRAEFAALLIRALQLPVAQTITEEMIFADHEGIAGWARPYIYAAAKAKLVNGYGDGTFRADERITRSEMAVMLVRALEGKHEGATQGGAVKPQFGDDNLIPAWAAGYVAEAVQAGLMQGKGGNRFAPNDNTLRAEAVAAMMNLLRQT